VYVRDTPDESRIDALCDLYEAVNREYDYYFRREERDLRHMLSHPELETTLWYQRDDDLVGFASLRWEPMASHDELWVSDVVASDSQAREGLVQAIEQTADERGADVVAMLTTHEPNRRWARVEKQVVVWNPFNAPAVMHERLNDGDWRLGLYDVE
jgi:hypothetical protein